MSTPIRWPELYMQLNAVERQCIADLFAEMRKHHECEPANFQSSALQLVAEKTTKVAHMTGGKVTLTADNLTEDGALAVGRALAVVKFAAQLVKDQGAEMARTVLLEQDFVPDPLRRRLSGAFARTGSIVKSKLTELMETQSEWANGTDEIGPIGMLLRMMTFGPKRKARFSWWKVWKL